MKLPVEGLKTRFTCAACLIAGTLSLVAYSSAVAARPTTRLPQPEAQRTGPQADYPIVVGEPYVVGGVTYTPVDVMNYDAVGFAAADASGVGVSGAHHTLPLPSYVEVTSLETGRTILVRLERRGPMETPDLIALSSGALAQLGAAPGAPVRVRRVNPQEFERARLRAGEPAAPRMDTPMSLVEILKRKLPESELATNIAPLPQAAEVAAPGTAVSASNSEVPAARPVAGSSGNFLVQAATFSTSDRADSAARVLGGKVSPSGKYFRVRTGPFATRGEAEASLAKVRAAGYRDARIFTSG